MMLLLTGLCAWVAADPEVASSANSVRSLQLLSFVLGGPGFAVLFALLVTGVLIASHASGPRWLVWLGIVRVLRSAGGIYVGVLQSGGVPSLDAISGFCLVAGGCQSVSCAQAGTWLTDSNPMVA